MTGLNPEKIKLKKVFDFISKNKNLKIIEIGAQYGPITSFLHKKGYSIKGTDIDPKAIKKAKEKSPEASFEVKDVLKINFSEYDIIIAWGLFEYILDLDKLINKIQKEMKKESVLIFSVPNVCSLSKRIRSLLGINPNVEKKPHLTFTFKDVRKLINKLNFNHKKITSTYYDGIKNLYFPTPKSLSSEIIVKMIK